MSYYAGIGSRETPPDILRLMTQAAKVLAEKGWILRSGGAIGADRAFESGAGRSKEIFYAKDCTEEAMTMASRHHPAWGRCSAYARQLHGRNCQILMGRDVNNGIPVKFVLCWTKDGRDTGGTGQAIRVSWAYDIKVYNLYYKEVRDRVLRMIAEHR